MTQELEKQVLSLVATDRLFIPSSSFDGKLERARPKIGKAIAASEDFQAEGQDYQGERTYATVATVNKHKARDMRAGVEQYCKEFPQEGKILNGMIEHERVKKETHLQFGMQEGKRLTRGDYIGVLTDMGLGPVTAEKYCDVALDISRDLSRKRGYEDRSVLIG